jgi:hypothetical protein
VEPRPFRSRITWLCALLALAGCATTQPLSLRDARRPGSPALAPEGQEIAGYFDSHGEFHEFHGYARVVGDGVELMTVRPSARPSAWSLRAPAADPTPGAPADSVRTLMVLRHHPAWPYLATFLAGFVGLLAVLAAAY